MPHKNLIFQAPVWLWHAASYNFLTYVSVEEKTGGDLGVVKGAENIGR